MKRFQATWLVVVISTHILGVQTSTKVENSELAGL